MRPGIIIRHAWGSYIFNIILHHCHCPDWLGDILPQRHFGLGAFCPTGILPHGHFAPRAFCPTGILAQDTMSLKDAGTTVKFRIVSNEGALVMNVV